MRERERERLCKMGEVLQILNKLEKLINTTRLDRENILFVYIREFVYWSIPLADTAI